MSRCNSKLQFVNCLLHQTGVTSQYNFYDTFLRQSVEYGHASWTELLAMECSTAGRPSQTVRLRVWFHRAVWQLTWELLAVCYIITPVTWCLLTMRLEWHNSFSTVIVWVPLHSHQAEQPLSKQKFLQNTLVSNYQNVINLLLISF